MDDLERMKADFAAKGGKTTVLPATEYENITSDDSRTKYWGEPIVTKEDKKRSNILRKEGLTVQDIPDRRNEYGGITGAREGTKNGKSS